MKKPFPQLYIKKKKKKKKKKKEKILNKEDQKGSWPKLEWQHLKLGTK